MTILFCWGILYSMTSILLYLSILLAAGLPAGWLLASGNALPGLLALGAGLGWLAVEVRLARNPLGGQASLAPRGRWQLVYMAGPGLVLLLGLVAWALLLGLPDGAALAAAISALAAWDLARFARRLALAPDAPMAARLERRHMARLAPALVLGAALGVLALWVRLPLGLGGALALAALAVFALARAARGLREG
jgi:hypothetical protein